MRDNLGDYLKTWVGNNFKTVHVAELYVHLEEDGEETRYVMKSTDDWEKFTDKLTNIENNCSSFSDPLQNCHLWFTDGSWAELDFDFDAVWQGLKLFNRPNIPEDLLCD